MRYFSILSAFLVLSLSACVSSGSTVSTEKEALAQEWADKVKEQDIVQPTCSFRADGVGGCYYE